ncbi:MAG: zf-HC2 domain-containing protein [Pseudomonadota bacterium]|nr:zf-HC2 domain-containing protein [Pseudomonadota bacterium]
MTAITDDMLTAYADGEADADERHAVERALEIDPALRDALAQYRALKVEIDRSYADVAAAPIPLRLLHTVIDSGRAVGPAPLARRFSGWMTPAAMAASLAVGAVAGTTFMQASAPQETILMASAAVADALSHEKDGAARGEVRVVATYQASGGEVCRSFRVAGAETSANGLACLDARRGWSLAALEPAAPEDAYLPAGEDGPDSLIASLTATMRAMTPEESDALLVSLQSKR